MNIMAELGELGELGNICERSNVKLIETWIVSVVRVFEERFYVCVCAVSAFVRSPFAKTSSVFVRMSRNVDVGLSEYPGIPTGF
jgi:hypothetical protein